jgi:hypothetical protein
MNTHFTLPGRTARAAALAGLTALGAIASAAVLLLA